MDEQPVIVEGIDEEDLIVQEVTQLGKLFRWWGHRMNWESAEERLLFMSLVGKEECIEQASVQSITRALIAKDGIPMVPHGLMMCEVNEQCWGKVWKNIMKLNDSKVRSFAWKLAHGGVRVPPFIKGVVIDERMCKCGLPATVNHILFDCNRGTSWDGMKRLLGTTQQPNNLKACLLEMHVAQNGRM